MSKPLFALTAGLGPVVETDIQSLEGDTRVIQALQHELRTQRNAASLAGRVKPRTLPVEMEIQKVRDAFKILIKHGEGGVVYPNRLILGGNVINTVSAVTRIGELFEEVDHTRLYGALPSIQADLMNGSAKKVINTMGPDENDNLLPSRITIFDPKEEMYFQWKPDIESAIKKSPPLLEREAFVPPINEDGDLLISSCINDDFFWKRVEGYMHSHPDANLYFQPGSVHIDKLSTPHLPQKCKNRMTVILNLDEAPIFKEKLEAKSHEHLHINDITLDIEAVLQLSKVEKSIKFAKELMEQEIREVVITDGTFGIINMVCVDGRYTAHLINAVPRNQVESLCGIDTVLDKSRLHQTGCGDTFTGAFIYLSRKFPRLPRKKILRTASAIATLHTFNDHSNIKNIDTATLYQILKKYEIPVT